MFGTPNRTAAALGKEVHYRDVMPDLEAALLWGHAAAMGAPVIAMGSSYSASLIFLLAARHPGALAALVAFSPGEYLDGPSVVHDAAQSVRIPVLVDEAKNPEEIATAKSILEAVASTEKQQVVPHSGGVHGASTLRTDKNAAGAEENWHALLAFLAPFAAP
jgi:dienelactone hydrolase